MAVAQLTLQFTSIVNTSQSARHSKSWCMVKTLEFSSTVLRIKRYLLFISNLILGDRHLLGIHLDYTEIEQAIFKSM